MASRDYTGQRVGILTLLSYARPGGAGVGAIWRVRCDCGRVTERVARQITAGRIRSCGECEEGREHATAARRRASRVGGSLRGAERRAYAMLRRRVLAEGAHWDLSPATYRELTMGTCVLCRRVPGKGEGRVIPLSQGPGYTLGNCGLLCRGCLALKGRRDYQQLLELLTPVLQYVLHQVVPQQGIGTIG